MNSDYLDKFAIIALLACIGKIIYLIVKFLLAFIVKNERKQFLISLVTTLLLLIVGLYTLLIFVAEGLKHGR